MNHSLKNTQKLFIDFLYKNEGFEELKINIISSSPYEILQVHRRHVWKSLRSTLESHYKVLYEFLGKNEFDHLAHLYIAENPSKVPDLELYGWNFPQFLETQIPEARIAHDIANLSIAAIRSLIGHHYTCTPIEEFLAITPEHYESLVFQINPTYITCELSYDIFDSFLNTKDFTKCKPKDNILAVLRATNNHLNYIRISKSEAKFIDLCAKKEPLLGIFTKMEEEFDLQTMLPKLVQNQLICGFFIKHT